MLVTTQQDATVRALLDFARARGLSEIMVPRQLHVVVKLPLLGSGKINYPGVTRLLAEGEAARAG